MRALFQKHAGSGYANWPGGSQWQTSLLAAAYSLNALCKFNVAAARNALLIYSDLLDGSCKKCQFN